MKDHSTLATITAAALIAAGAQSTHAAILQENLGNFPDAIAITAEWNANFSNLSINGNTINGPGFLFTMSNTSFGNGAFSSFAFNPDGDFATNDSLTPGAQTALANAQPYGMFGFGAQLPSGSGVITSAPAGFALNIRTSGFMFAPILGSVEVNFEHSLLNPDGLLFDGAAGLPPSVFTNPLTGTFQFFISTPEGNTLLDNLLTQNGLEAGMNIMTELAWEEGGIVKSEFNTPGIGIVEGAATALRPRGQLSIAIPSSGGFSIAAGMMVVLGARRRR